MKKITSLFMACLLIRGTLFSQYSLPLQVNSETGKITRPVDAATFTNALEASSYGIDHGSTDAYRVDLIPARIGYTIGEHYRVRPNTSNTGAATLNFNGHPAAPIKKWSSGSLVDLATGDIAALQWFEVVWDGTNWQILSLGGGSSGGGSGDMLLGTAQTITARKSFNDSTLRLNGSTSGFLDLSAGAFATSHKLTLTLSADVNMILPGTDFTVARTDAGNNFIGNQTMTGTLQIQNGLVVNPQPTPTAVKTANYTAAAGDIVPVDTTSGAITVTLPTAPADKSEVIVKMVIQGGTNAVTINCSGSDVFNKTGGSTSATLSLLAQAINLQYKSTGAIWYVVADDTPLAQLDIRYPQLAGNNTFTGTNTIATVNATTVNATNFTGKADVIEASLFAADAGSTDTYVATYSPALTAYVTGTEYRFKANTSNTGAASINLNGLGAKTIVKVEGGITTALADNDILAGQWVTCVYDGTNMQMLSMKGNAPSGSVTLTSTQVAYGSGGNAVTSEAAFSYNAATNIATIGGISLGAGSEVSSIGPLVDSVDGTTPLNNINQVVASGTAYTLTTSYAAVAFGTTSPILTIANAGAYTISIDLQTTLVSATTTTQSVKFKLSRTNNTPADLPGSEFSDPLPVATITSESGPCIHIGPIKYITTNTNDTLTVQGILSASLGAGTVTITNATITAERKY